MKRVLAVVALLVLAGCNGVGGVGGQGTPTVTPAPVPTDERTESGFAPGVTTDDVVDPDALSAAHSGALDNRSYSLSAVRTVRDARNGSLRSRVGLRAEFDRDRSHSVRLRITGPDAVRALGTPPVEAAFWANGTVYVRSISRRNFTTYNTFQPIGGAGTWRYWAHFSVFDELVTFDPGLLLVAVPIRDSETRTVGGQRRVVFESGSVPEAALPPSEQRVRNLELTAVVTESGLVRSHRLSYTVTVEGRPVRVTRRVQYADVGGTTVERPDWYEKAVANGSDGYP